MTTRRQFIRGAVAVAVSAALPGAEYTYKTFRVGHDWTYNGKTITTFLPEGHELSVRMTQALARSMMQTREIVTANVLNKAFGGSDETESDI